MALESSFSTATALICLQGLPVELTRWLCPLMTLTDCVKDGPASPHGAMQQPLPRRLRIYHVCAHHGMRHHSLPGTMLPGRLLWAFHIDLQLAADSALSLMSMRLHDTC